MERPRRLLPSALVLFVLGAVIIARFAPGVRSVAVVGLAGGGLAIGAGVSLLIQARRSRTRI